MAKRERKFFKVAPEMKEWIERYGIVLADDPPYVLIGQYNSKKIGPVQGILAATDNEFHAHILKREFCKAGRVEIKTTEFHPDGDSDFSMKDYRARIRQRMAERRAKKEQEKQQEAE